MLSWWELQPIQYCFHVVIYGVQFPVYFSHKAIMLRPAAFMFSPQILRIQTPFLLAVTFCKLWGVFLAPGKNLPHFISPLPVFL